MKSETYERAVARPIHRATLLNELRWHPDFGDRYARMHIFLRLGALIRRIQTAASSLTHFVIAVRSPAPAECSDCPCGDEPYVSRGSN